MGVVSALVQPFHSFWTSAAPVIYRDVSRTSLPRCHCKWASKRAKARQESGTPSMYATSEVPGERERDVE